MSEFILPISGGRYSVIGDTQKAPRFNVVDFPEVELAVEECRRLAAGGQAYKLQQDNEQWVCRFGNMPSKVSIQADDSVIHAELNADNISAKQASDAIAARDEFIQTGESTDKPWYKKSWFWILLAIVAAILVYWAYASSKKGRKGKKGKKGKKCRM